VTFAIEGAKIHSLEGLVRLKSDAAHNQKGKICRRYAKSWNKPTRAEWP